MSTKNRFVPVVAVLNMKGGVGKTTVSAHVFRALFQERVLSTLLIDLDPQFNLSQQLFTREEYDKKKAENNTVYSVMEPPSEPSLFKINVTDEPPPSARAIGSELFYFRRSDPRTSLVVIPGDFRMVKYSLMDDNKQLASVRKRFFKFIESEKANFGVICIDCNPSSSFLTLCALQACTHVLVPVRPDKYSVLGLEVLNEFIDNVPSISPKPHLLIALNGMPRSIAGTDAARIETELRGHAEFGLRTMARVIHESSHLKAKTDYTGFASDRKGPWSGVVRAELARFAEELAGK